MPNKCELNDEDLNNINGGVDVQNINKNSVTKAGSGSSISKNSYVVEKNQSANDHCFLVSSIENGLLSGYKITKSFGRSNMGFLQTIGNESDFVLIVKPGWVS